MNEEEMIQKIQDTICLLYQNQAREAIDRMTDWLDVFQSFLENCGEAQNMEIKNFGILMMRELLEAYQSHDVIAMGDCMTEKAMLFVKAYFQEANMEGIEG